MAKKEEKDRAKWLLMAIIVVAALWYFCIIKIAEFPSPYCAVSGGGGTCGGGTSGGTNGGDSLTCPDPCRAGTHFDATANCCVPNPTGGNIPCPHALITTAICTCPTGYYWDTGLQLCTPAPTGGSCVDCPFGKYDTYYGTCRCADGYYWDTGVAKCCPAQIL